MIFVAGFGRMCNNMLQFGHFYAWGKERGLCVIALRFCYKYPFFRIKSQRGYNWLTYLAAKYGARLGLLRRVDFDCESCPGDARLDILQSSRFVVTGGWEFRDYEAFLRHSGELREMFAFKPSVVRRVELSLPPMPDDAISLGVHVRRGDYSRWQEGKYLFTDEEYIKVIHSFAGYFEGRRIRTVIATNDKSLPAGVYREALGVEVHLLSGSAGEDLYALSGCDYIIGPPSTFSLMASFYRDTPLYWIYDPAESASPTSFRRFDYLFRHII
ncbi:MAG: alpha-1,2-fucosyltransferase [Tannerellaceae bacterium]|jgi:hypothetical protein|nr:alpha-1,2-fucosyltransferase [Tannerellaceae bacterium]